MLTMQRDPIKISWDELSSDKVDAKLKRLDAINRAREQFDKPVHAPALRSEPRFAWLMNTLVYMTLFGALGGLLGFGFGEIMRFVLPNDRMESLDLIATHKELAAKLEASPNDPTLAIALKEVERAARRNEYFAIYVNPQLSADEKEARTNEIAERDAWKAFIANLVFFGVSGMMISVALSSAESIVSRNVRGAVLDGSVGAVTGLVGGVVIAVYFNDIYAFAVQYLGADNFEQEVLVSAVTWGVMGLFIAIAPGIMMRNGKRMLIGAMGGLVGGLIGGALFVPIARQTGNDHVSRLVAIVIIGLVAGLGTGVLENVAKNGWIKVKEGLIAGKQFVLYRNPTYIGSAPNCHVYLFKDAKVGRRHAAIHVVPGGFEIEDLPLGERTQVNGRTVTRARLKTGDKIHVGSTVFEFNEKAKQL